MFSPSSFGQTNVPAHLRPLLAELSNHSLAKSTWSSYRTSVKKLEEFSEETATPIGLPISDDTAIAFVAWLLSKGITASTVDTYLSGVRQWHLVSGTTPPLLRTPLISTVLKGKKNLDNIEKLTGRAKTRIPITPNLLKHMKSKLKKGDAPAHDRKLLWACSTICFSGGLRCGEILCKKPKKFDPDTDFLHSQIRLNSININGTHTEILQLTLKSEKTNSSGTPTVVDIYPSQSSVCPISAFKKWQAAKPEHQSHLPAFRLQNGDNLTLRAFNKFLKETFDPLLAGKNGSISGHSLRIGLASMLGSLGYADEEVMAAGRWSSRAFKAYLKLPRTRRLEVARAIGKN